MGCGTGPLGPSNAYEVTLTFDTGRIPKNDPIYTHFKSALDFLLRGLRAVGANGWSTEKTAGADVTSIAVWVEGPLDPLDAVNFNRAFNRLLWGVRYRKSPGSPSPSNRSVTPSDQTWTDENT